MRKAFYSLLFAGLLAGCQSNSSQTKENETPASEDFVRISGQDLIQPDGSKLFIKGTNLGNWLNPEGYMFGFNKTNSGRFINEMFCQLVGPDFTSDFWKSSKTTTSPERTSSLSHLRERTLSGYLFIIRCLPMKTIWA